MDDDRHADGRRRLDDPDDLVRREIARALERSNVHVIPVLVDGADATERELPPDLAPVSRRQACELSDSRWDYDVEVLTGRLRDLLGERARRRWPRAAPAGVALVVAVALAALLLRPALTPPVAPSTRAATLSGLTLDRDISFGQYLDRKASTAGRTGRRAAPQGLVRPVRLPHPGIPRPASSAAMAADRRAHGRPARAVARRRHHSRGGLWRRSGPPRRPPRRAPAR